MEFRGLLILILLGMFVSHAFCSEEAAKGEKVQPRHRPQPGIKAAKPPVPNIPQEYKDLEKIYYDYWGLIVKNEYEKAYDLESSAYKRANPYSKEKYENIFPKNKKLTSVLVLNVEKKDEKEVVVKGNYYYEIGALKSVRPFSDRWVMEKGLWKHVPTEGQFKQ